MTAMHPPEPNSFKQDAWGVNDVVAEAPVTLIQKDSTAEATAAAEADAATSTGAESIEAEWTKKEAEYGAEIASLNKEGRDLQRQVRTIL